MAKIEYREEHKMYVQTPSWGCLEIELMQFDYVYYVSVDVGYQDLGVTGEGRRWEEAITSFFKRFEEFNECGP